MFNLEKNKAPLKLLFTVIIAILLSEIFIMTILKFLPRLPHIIVPVVDSALLILILLPVLYFFFYRPLVIQVSQIKKAEEAMHALTLVDELTGVYNRRGFLSFAEQMLRLSERTQRGLILIFTDVNNLKQINDKYGHSAGDAALKCTASVLKYTFRRSDVIGRVGGDEFAILALEAKQENMDVLRNRLRNKLKEAECNINTCFKLSISLGIVYYNPSQPCSIEELLRRADVLMYEEKKYLQEKNNGGAAQAIQSNDHRG